MAETAPDPKRQRLDDDEVDQQQPEADVEAGASGQEEIDEADDGVEEGPSGEVDICGFLGVDPELLQTYDQQQAVLEQVQEECSEAILKVEHNYAKKKRPLLTQRSQVLQAIPGFWKKVLESHPQFKQYFTDADLAVLDHLVEVDVDDSEDASRTAWKIRLVFDENPYFENTEIVKEYRYPDDSAPLVSTCTELVWREGKAPLTEEQQQALGSKRPPPGANDYNFINYWLRGEPEGVYGGSDPLADVLREEIWPNPLAVLQGALQDEEDGEGDGQQLFELEEGGYVGEEGEEEGGEGSAEGYDDQGGPIEIDDEEEDEGGFEEGYDAAAAAGEEEEGGTTGAGDEVEEYGGGDAAAADEGEED